MSLPIDSKEEGKISINRYLLVTCRLDESKIPEAIMEKVPETVEELKALEALKKQAAGTVSGVGAIPFGADATMPSVPQVPGSDNPAPPAATDTPVKDPATTEPVNASGAEPPVAPEKSGAPTGDGTVPQSEPPQPPSTDPPKSRSREASQVVQQSSLVCVSKMVINHLWKQPHSLQQLNLQQRLQRDKMQLQLHPSYPVSKTLPKKSGRNGLPLRKRK